MLNLHFAPSLNLLIPELLRQIRSVWTDPFRPPKFLVPSPAVGKWLNFRLADCDALDAGGHPLGLGCTANLEMSTLENFLWNALSPLKDMHRMDAAVMQQVVYALLRPDLLDEACYSSVKSYLTQQDDTIDPVKRIQLASRISRQFQEYEFNRPSVWDEERRTWRLDGIDATWLKNKVYSKDNADSELWQKDLYCRAIEHFQHAELEENIRYISIPHLYRLRRETGLNGNSAWTVSPDNIFLFGVSKVSHFHRNTLVEISQMRNIEMHVFLANPCAEFWEDVDTRRHRGKLRRAWTSNSDATCAGIAPRSPDDYGKEELKDLDQPPPTRDHSLLELWGNAGKANIFLWCARALWNFEYHSPSWVETEKHPDSLLKTVQYSLLRCSNELPRGLLADNSLQVLACADPGREVEELREHILDLVKSASVDYLTEIVVYVADIGAYVSHIQRVFGAFRQDDAEYIPFSVLGAPGTNSVFAQGMHTLLKIFEGHFDRAHVFALLRNQIVQCTRRFSPDNVAVWESWAEELGIFRGYNRRQREEMGDRGETATDSHTFELGIARLLIGNLAADPADMNLTLLAGDNAPAFIPIPPFRNFDTSDFDSIEAFCKLVEDLYICVSTLRACGTLSDSVDVAIKIVGDWMSVIPEEQTWNLAVEGRIRNEFLEALPAIKLQNSLGKREEPTQISEFVALALQCLPEELPAGSKAWSGGITFAPLRPAMIVPHKVVFALGLDATAFPGVSDKPGWDLLSHKQIVGDSDPVRDNRFAFLELLHAAQERLVLSFRARNMQKEELLQPSSVVCELESYLSQQGLRIPDEVLHEARCSVRRDIPWIVRESLENLVTPERFWGSWEASTVRLACIERETGMRTARHRHGTRFEAPAHPTANHVQTTAYDLRLFIANPLEYHLSRTLGLDIDEQPATMCATDEPLQSGALEMSELQKEIWSQLLALAFPENAMDSLETPEELADKAEDIARAVHADYVIRGCSPEAQLCSMEGQFLVNWARQCAAITLDLRTRFGSHKLLVNAGMSLGRPWMTGFVSIDMGEGKDCAVDCRHGFALVPRSAIGEIGIIAVKKEGDAKSNPDLWLTGTLQWLAEQHSERPDACTVQRVQLNRGNGKEQKAGWSAAPLAHTAPLPLRIWLADRIREMLLDRCADHLPFAVVKDITKQSKRNPISWDQRFAKVTVAGVEEKLSDGVHSPYSCFLEGFKLAEARIPFSDEPDKIRRDEKLLDLVKRRFAVMLKDMDP